MKTPQEIFTIEKYSKKQYDYLDIINIMNEYASQFYTKNQVEILQEEAYKIGLKHGNT